MWSLHLKNQSELEELKLTTIIPFLCYSHSLKSHFISPFIFIKNKVFNRRGNNILGYVISKKSSPFI